mgnify:CR=1 FL=1
MMSFEQRYKAYIDGYKCWPDPLPNGHGSDEQCGWWDAKDNTWDPPVEPVVIPETKESVLLPLVGVVLFVGFIIYVVWIYHYAFQAKR